MIRKDILVACVLALLAGACRTADHDEHQATEHAEEEGHEAHARHEEHDDHAAHEQHDEHAGRVRLSAEQMEQFGITIAAAGPGSIDLGVELPCEVHPNGDRLAHIAPRFPGIVKDVRKTIGDQVRAGDVLATIESSESLAPYQLTTLIDGTVIEKHLTRGEAVDRDKQAFAIADLSSVWVDCGVFQKDLERVDVGKRVRVSAGEGAAQGEGVVSYVTPVVHQPTRTATARVVLENPGGRWRPGMFVTARVLEPVEVPLAVGRAAIQTVNGERVVFIETDEGFAPQAVRVGRAGAVDVEILSGLEPGARYVATNSFLLKAELGKDSAEHQH